MLVRNAIPGTATSYDARFYPAGGLVLNDGTCSAFVIDSANFPVSVGTINVTGGNIGDGGPASVSLSQNLTAGNYPASISPYNYTDTDRTPLSFTTTDAGVLNPWPMPVVLRTPLSTPVFTYTLPPSGADSGTYAIYADTNFTVTWDNGDAGFQAQYMDITLNTFNDIATAQPLKWGAVHCLFPMAAKTGTIRSALLSKVVAESGNSTVALQLLASEYTVEDTASRFVFVRSGFRGLAQLGTRLLAR